MSTIQEEHPINSFTKFDPYNKCCCGNSELCDSRGCLFKYTSSSSSTDAGDAEDEETIELSLLVPPTRPVPNGGGFEGAGEVWVYKRSENSNRQYDVYRDTTTGLVPVSGAGTYIIVY
jgi:hypothetical protein